MTIGIIRTGLCNLSSVTGALERTELGFGFADDPSQANQFDRLILPGVGAAKPAMDYLNETKWSAFLKRWDKPILGICLGMQLLFETSDEGGQTACLGILPGRVEKMTPKNDLVVPHMGWNRLVSKRPSTFDELLKGEHFAYFVHSFQAVTSSDYIWGTCDYGGEIPAIVGKDHIVGMQFHPEKSGGFGEELIKRWANV